MYFRRDLVRNEWCSVGAIKLEARKTHTIVVTSFCRVAPPSPVYQWLSVSWNLQGPKPKYARNPSCAVLFTFS